MRCGLVDSLEWVFPDSEICGQPCSEMVIDVPRAGTAAITILIKEVTPGLPIRFALSPRPGTPARFFRLRDVPVESNTGPLGFTEKEGERNEFVTRRAPFRVYDAMEPVGSSFEARAATEAVRLHLPISADARAGTFDYLLAIDHAKETRHLKITVVVHRALLPPVGRDSWSYTNWFSYENMATRHSLKPWSEAHWDMIGRYARLMARGRQNTFWFTFEDVFIFGEKGFVLNRERLRRIVRTFTRAGLYYIEGGHFGRRSTSDWKCPTFSVSLAKSLATSPEGNAHIAGAARQLMEEIECNRWRDRYHQHVTDEPIKDNAVDYRIFVGIVRKYMPGIPIVDALMDPTMSGSVNIWCPQGPHYQRERALFDGTRAQGDRLWFYTCCFPGGPWLNRLLDMELLRPALLGWGAALFRLDGFLHWGLNFYQPKQDPFEMSVIPCWVGSTNSLPAGDTHVVYPGKGEPWSSLRFESQREGVEDLELLRRLLQEKPAQASTLIRSVIRGFDDYTKDISVFRAARRKLLKMS